MVLSVSSPVGDATYSCAGPAGLALTGGALFVECELKAGNTRSALVSVANYHGSDTYNFTCDATNGQDCTQTDDNEVYIPMGQYDIRATGPGAFPGFPAASCSFTITGPATLSRGDHVSGSFHCDNVIIFGDLPLDAGPPPASSAPPPPTIAPNTVDGRFDGTAWN